MRKSELSLSCHSPLEQAKHRSEITRSMSSLPTVRIYEADTEEDEGCGNVTKINSRGKASCRSVVPRALGWFRKQQASQTSTQGSCERLSTGRAREREWGRGREGKRSCRIRRSKVR